MVHISLFEIVNILYYVLSKLHHCTAGINNKPKKCSVRDLKISTNILKVVPNKCLEREENIYI